MRLDRIFELEGVGLAAKLADLPLPLEVALIVVIAVSLFHFCAVRVKTYPHQ